VAAAATTTGAAACNRDALKRAHNAGRGLGGRFKLVPVGGVLGAPVYALADVAADGGVSKTAFIESALQDMSLTLCKGTGRVQSAHLSQVVQASGRANLRESPAPVAGVVGLAC
jgi:hypothetical protein